MLLGIRTVVYYVRDLERAKAWWSELLGIEPYFDQPFYIGFNVGGYELGLHPVEGDGPTAIGAEDTVTYWGVTEIGGSVQRLLERGGAVHHAIQDVGEGIRVAAVRDPFGNVVGLIENPNFKLPVAPTS